VRWFDDEKEPSPFLTSKKPLVSQREKAGAISTFRRSSSPSTNMQKQRPATAISF
jgi:hypothetical protein